MVALRVDGTLVQWVLAVMDAQEACALLESLITEAWHIF